MGKPTENPRLGAALREQKDRGNLKVETLESAFSVSETTAREILRGGWDDLIADMRHALTVMPRPAVDAFLGVLLAGTGLDFTRPAGCGDGDFNGDGRTDKSDAGEGAGLATEEAVGVLRRVQAGANRYSTFSEEEAAAINADLDEVGRTVARLRCAVAGVTERQRPGVRIAK